MWSLNWRVGAIFMNLPLFRIGWQNAYSASVPVPRINRDQFNIWQSVRLVLVLHLFVLHLLALMPHAIFLHFLIGWLRTWTLLKENTNLTVHGKTVRLRPRWRLHQSPCAYHLVQTVRFICIYLSFFCFILPMNATIMHPVMDPSQKKNTDFTVRNHGSNFIFMGLCIVNQI
jgi:hypothetical protein